MSKRTAISAARKLSSFLSSTPPPFPKIPPSSFSHHRHLLPPSFMTSPLHHHHHHHHHHNSLAMMSSSSSSSLTLHRFLSSSSSSSSSSPNQSDPNPNPNPNSASEMKHQEIEGPTVDRDLSPLATESREVTSSLLKTMYNLTKLLAILGLSHLCLGTYTYALASSSSSSSPSSPLMIQMSVASAIAFGFPFSMAFLLRQSLKHMHFFQKMEQIGRLQILTSNMQISKNLLLFFFRLRAVSYLCVAGLSFSFFYSLYSYL